MPLTVTVTNPVGVGQIEGLNGVSAFPVPTTGELSLDLDPGAELMDLTMELRDASGRLVMSEQERPRTAVGSSTWAPWLRATTRFA